ncbi:tropinone reductase-like 3 [Artemisia annua]|uniref:Tropinone reductase-like 3 n=1 Tax=Artemisia annua TaxID=35608 RepID=A0A2U1MH92_ARTAN|nr:tropinone reductase-like 3 [Artemisia annua]
MAFSVATAPATTTTTAPTISPAAVTGPVTPKAPTKLILLEEEWGELRGEVDGLSKVQIKARYIHQINMGKFDVVVSNAAANPSVDTILQTKELALDKLWEINVKTSILLQYGGLGNGLCGTLE